MGCRDFYDTFVSIRRGLFNTRDRAEHSRKRKIVSHTFAPKSVLEFEPYIRQNLEIFIKQWDRISANKERDGYGRVDCLNWCMSILTLLSNSTDVFSQLPCFRHHRRFSFWKAIR